MALSIRHGRGPCLASWALLSLGSSAVALWAGEPVQLRERFPIGYQYHVSTRTELAGTLTRPAEKDQPAAQPLAVTGRSFIEYDERVLEVEADGKVQKTARIFRRIDFERKVGDRPQPATIRPEVRRLIILRHGPMEVPFSPDGPLTWGEIDLVRTDVFTPALTGLLPDGPVVPGARWPASNLAVQELTDLERIEEGRVECRLEQVAVVEKRRHARVAFAGMVRGVNEDGPNRQQLEGYFFFDLQSNHLSYLYLKGVSFLLDKAGKTLGRVEGQFVLTRQAPRACEGLADEALKGLELAPAADNTLLLYDNPELGVRFLHSRRWRVAGVRGRQLGLDESKGSGVLVTVEPAASAPTGAQFVAEARDWLARQGKVLRIEEPRQRPGVSYPLEHFAIEAEIAGQRVVMDYHVVRQAAGAATLAARLLPADRESLQPELDRLARSLTITRTITAEAPKK